MHTKTHALIKVNLQKQLECPLTDEWIKNYGPPYG